MRNEKVKELTQQRKLEERDYYGWGTCCEWNPTELPEQQSTEHHHTVEEGKVDLVCLVFNYHCSLIHELCNIVLPFEVLPCCDLQCCNLNHLQAINMCAHNISDARIRAAEATIPVTCHKHTSGRIPSRSEFIQPIHDGSFFWHRMWLDCDRPRHGAVAYFVTHMSSLLLCDSSS